MSCGSPQIFVSFSFDDEENDDRSEVTWSSGADGNSLKENSSIEGHPTLAETSIQEHHKQILHLERKLARQKEKLDIFSTNLRQSRAEEDVINAEKASLIDELDLVHDSTADQSNNKMGITRGITRCLSLKGLSSGGEEEGDPNANFGGSMQMLLIAHDKLVAENARFQVSEEIIRKSFLSHVKYCNQLHHRNEMLQQQLSASTNVLLSKSEHTDRTAFYHRNEMVHQLGAGNNVRLSTSERMGKTASTGRSLNDSDNHDDFAIAMDIGIDCYQHATAQDSLLMTSLRSIPEKEDIIQPFIYQAFPMHRPPPKASQEPFNHFPYSSHNTDY